MEADINYLRSKLEDEKKRLEEELSTFAKKIKKGDEEEWEAVPDDNETDIEFQDEYADASEELEERQAEKIVLEKELKKIEEALGRIEAGTYGHCSVCGATIETDRLNIEPQAPTCVEHKDHL